MNGELVDWADATVHVGTHGLHYGSGVFEGIRAYETERGTAIFRLGEHMERSRTRRSCCTWSFRTRVDELKAACWDLIGANGLPECYLRPIAFSATASSASPRRAIPSTSRSWRGRGARTSARRACAKASASRSRRWQRVGAERHPARGEGDRRLPELDARGRRGDAGRLRGGDPPHRTTATSPTARARTSSSSRTASSHTPDLSASILPGITRDTIIQIAQDLGYPVVEKQLIRTDLYLADEVFMCGTAAEVTPIREVDDHVIGPARAGDARDPEGVPRHRARAQRAVGAVARVRAESHQGGVKQEVRPVPLSGPYLDEREEELVLEVLRSGRLSLGPTIDRFEEAFADEGRRAVCGRGLLRDGRPSPAVHLRGHRARRRGDHDAVLVRGDGQLLRVRGRRPRVRRRRPAHAEPRPGRGRGGGHAADEGDRRRRHLRLSVRAGRAARDRGAPRARAHRRLVRGARRAVQGRAARLARAERRLRLLPEQADHDRRGRDGDDALGGGVAPAPLAAQPGARRRAAAGSTTCASASTTGRRRRSRARPRAAREARRDPRAPLAGGRRATASCLRAWTASSCRAPTTPTTCGRGSSTS